MPLAARTTLVLLALVSCRSHDPPTARATAAPPTAGHDAGTAAAPALAAAELAELVPDESLARLRDLKPALGRGTVDCGHLADAWAGLAAALPAASPGTLAALAAAIADHASALGSAHLTDPDLGRDGDELVAALDDLAAALRELAADLAAGRREDARAQAGRVDNAVGNVAASLDRLTASCAP